MTHSDYGQSACDVWGCRLAAIETLFFLNPLCGGWGQAQVCKVHLFDGEPLMERKR